jgi:hypothetical protein
MDSAEDLRGMQISYEETKVAQANLARSEAALGQARRVSESVSRHFDDARFTALLAAMRRSAEAGSKKHLALTFPSDACTDRGRKINSAETAWEATLQGEAADMFQLWRTILRPQGFHLTAEILDFPNGMPGDVGLTVSWGGA